MSRRKRGSSRDLERLILWFILFLFFGGGSLIVVRVRDGVSILLLFFSSVFFLSLLDRLLLSSPLFFIGLLVSWYLVDRFFFAPRRAEGAAMLYEWHQQQRMLRQRRLDELSPDEFESQVALVYGRLGYDAQVRPLRAGGGDGGVDVVARLGGRVILIQCKHQARPVGAPVVRDLIGTVANERADKGVLVTSSTTPERAGTQIPSMRPKCTPTEVSSHTSRSVVPSSR